MAAGATSRAAIPKAAAFEVGQRIKARRQALGLTQAVLAGEELTKQLISQIESGQTRPSSTSLALIAGRLRVGVDDLLGPTLETYSGRDADVAYGLRSAAAMLASNEPDRALEALGTLTSTHLKPAQRVVFHRLLADIELAHGNASEALTNALIACRHSGDSDDAEQAALAHNAVGRAQFHLNRLPAAIRYYDTALEFAQGETVDPALLARIQTNRGNALMRLGDSEAATTAYEQARLAAENAENLRSLALAYMGLGEASRERGDYSRAIAHMELAVDLFDRLESRHLQVHNLHNLGEVCAERGDVVAARHHFEAALAAATTMGDATPRGYALERLAALDVAQDAALKAVALAEEAIGIAREIRDGDLLARALATFGDACQRLGDADQADSAYRDALAQGNAASGRAVRQVLMQQGNMLRQRGDYEAATRAFEGAARMRG
jgi:tetratricopeptide (TPR) repeat protein/DNA-binding XRE family transcriptional regulator